MAATDDELAEAELRARLGRVPGSRLVEPAFHVTPLPSGRVKLRCQLCGDHMVVPASDPPSAWSVRHLAEHRRQELAERKQAAAAQAAAIVQRRGPDAYLETVMDLRPGTIEQRQMPRFSAEEVADIVRHLRRDGRPSPASLELGEALQLAVNLGPALRAERERRGCSLLVAGRQAGVKPSVFGAYERGERWPAREQMARLADWLKS